MQLIHQKEEQRFDYVLEQGTAFVEYRLLGEVYDLYHVRVPESLRGQGVAGKMMQAVLEFIKAEKGQIRATCSYAQAYLEKHPEYQDLVFSEN